PRLAPMSSTAPSPATSGRECTARSRSPEHETRGHNMRVESSVTTVSWIPSEAIKGMTKMPFEVGVGHYDNPMPDTIDLDKLEQLRDEDRFRFANHLRAWIEVKDGRIVDYGQ